MSWYGRVSNQALILPIVVEPYLVCSILYEGLTVLGVGCFTIGLELVGPAGGFGVYCELIFVDAVLKRELCRGFADPGVGVLGREATCCACVVAEWVAGRRYECWAVSIVAPVRVAGRGFELMVI